MIDLLEICNTEVAFANVRMVLQRKASVSLLDLMFCGARAQAESGVRVFGRGCSSTERHGHTCLRFGARAHSTQASRGGSHYVLSLLECTPGAGNWDCLAGNHF